MLKGQAKKDYQKELMRKRRGLTGSNKTEVKGLTNEGSNGVNDMGSNTSVHPVVKMLSDPLKRAKLRAICNSLSNHNMLGNVALGCNRPISMLEVSELLEAF